MLKKKKVVMRQLSVEMEEDVVDFLSNNALHLERFLVLFECEAKVGTEELVDYLSYGDNVLNLTSTSLSEKSLISSMTADDHPRRKVGWCPYIKSSWDKNSCRRLSLHTEQKTHTFPLRINNAAFSSGTSNLVSSSLPFFSEVYLPPILFFGFVSSCTSSTTCNFLVASSLW
jgi:hypothetical protein